jgi:hypothetical protein
MKRLTHLCALAALVLATAGPLHAQDNGYWKAVSKTARSITGDISIKNEKLTIYFSVFIIAEIRSLEAAEAMSVFNADEGGSGNLYRLNIPADRQFLHRNTLCGAEPTEWMATYRTGKDMQIAFFSGSKMPVFTPDAISSSTNLCGTYTYSR